jgi:hypothetical protein
MKSFLKLFPNAVIVLVMTVSGCATHINTQKASAALRSDSDPTPKELVASLMGTWVGTITSSVNGQIVKGSYTQIITPLGNNGLGYKSSVTARVGNGKPTTGTSYQHDNGELDGTTSQDGNTTSVLNGTWHIQNSTIYGTITVQLGSRSFTETTQTFITAQTLNAVVNYSFGGGAVGKAWKAHK